MTITGERTPGLTGPGGVGTGGNQVTCQAAVCAEVVICTAAPLVRGEGTPNAAGTIHLHGTRPSRGKKGRGTVMGGRSARLLLMLGLVLLGGLLGPTTLNRSRQVVLDGDGLGDIRLKTGRNIAARSHLKTNCLPKFS